MDALDRKGAPFHYYFASRNSEENLPLRTGVLPRNGMVIYALWKADPSRLVMIRQYRYPVGDWVYELPAGLIEAGETAPQAAARELEEETGLVFEACTDVDPAFTQPTLMGPGFTDETSTAVYGYASGTIRQAPAEDTESIEVLLADAEEARRILREEKVSLRASLLLMQFLQADTNQPFRFLQ